MFVEFVDKFGGKPVRVEASQLAVYNDNYDLILVAGEYGPAKAVRYSHCQDADFRQTVRAFGYDVRRVPAVAQARIGTASPLPAGAKLVHV